MTQDVKESLTALVAVGSYVLLFWVALRLMHAFATPPWLGPLVDGMGLLAMILGVGPWLWRRRRATAARDR